MLRALQKNAIYKLTRHPANQKQGSTATCPGSLPHQSPPLLPLIYCLGRQNLNTRYRQRATRTLDKNFQTRTKLRQDKRQLGRTKRISFHRRRFDGIKLFPTRTAKATKIPVTVSNRRARSLTTSQYPLGLKRHDQAALFQQPKKEQESQGLIKYQPPTRKTMDGHAVKNAKTHPYSKNFGQKSSATEQVFRQQKRQHAHNRPAFNFLSEPNHPASKNDVRLSKNSNVPAMWRRQHAKATPPSMAISKPRHHRPV